MISRPAVFDPEVPPPGFDKMLISFWRDRPHITPRLQLTHTNAAGGEGTIASAYRWANQQGSSHTIPHCQMDRNGDAAMMLPSNRKGIANYKAATFSLGFETADTGTRDDPTISAFTDAQAEQVAVANAYYSILHGIPLEYPTSWDGTGSACHTEPFGYPHWTNARGKTCPGPKKKRQFRDEILPYARQIVAAWTAPAKPAPTPTEDDDMAKPFLARADENKYELRRGNGIFGSALRKAEYGHLHDDFPAGFFINPLTGQPIESWGDIPTLSETELDLYIGYVNWAAYDGDEG